MVVIIRVDHSKTVKAMKLLHGGQPSRSLVIDSMDLKDARINTLGPSRRFH